MINVSCRRLFYIFTLGLGFEYVQLMIEGSKAICGRLITKQRISINYDMLTLAVSDLHIPDRASVSTDITLIFSIVLTGVGFSGQGKHGFPMCSQHRNRSMNN